MWRQTDMNMVNMKRIRLESYERSRSRKKALCFLNFISVSHTTEATSIHICDCRWLDHFDSVSACVLVFYTMSSTDCAQQQGGARGSYAHLIQTGTCQQHTMCSWPQQPGPPQSDTCRPHTMCSCPPRSCLSHAGVIVCTHESTPG
jgi:hypothetical protein